MYIVERLRIVRQPTYGPRRRERTCHLCTPVWQAPLRAPQAAESSVAACGHARTSDEEYWAACSPTYAVGAV